MVTGGVAAVVYGDPRFTRDIDIVLELGPEGASAFASAFDSARYYVPPLETLRREAARRRYGHFNVIHKDSALRADIYLLDDRELHRAGFERRRKLELENTSISIAPPEYVMLSKLEYYRDSGSDRHLRDIAMILRISADAVDLAVVERWISRLGLEEQWKAARTYDPH